MPSREVDIDRYRTLVGSRKRREIQSPLRYARKSCSDDIGSIRLSEIRANQSPPGEKPQIAYTRTKSKTKSKNR